MPVVAFHHTNDAFIGFSVEESTDKHGKKPTEAIVRTRRKMFSHFILPVQGFFSPNTWRNLVPHYVSIWAITCV
jgi:hypothetical protein